MHGRETATAAQQGAGYGTLHMHCIMGGEIRPGLPLPGEGTLGIASPAYGYMCWR